MLICLFDFFFQGKRYFPFYYLHIMLGVESDPGPFFVASRFYCISSSHELEIHFAISACLSEFRKSPTSNFPGTC